MFCKSLFFEPNPLVKAVESNVIGEIQNRVDVFVSISRCKYVHFFIHFTSGKQCFIKTGSGRPCKIFRYNGECTPHAVTLESTDNLNSRLVLDVFQQLKIFAEARFLEDKAWARNLGVINHIPNLSSFGVAKGDSTQIKLFFL